MENSLSNFNCHNVKTTSKIKALVVYAQIKHGYQNNWIKVLQAPTGDLSAMHIFCYASIKRIFNKNLRFYYNQMEATNAK